MKEKTEKLQYNVKNDLLDVDVNNGFGDLLNKLTNLDESNIYLYKDNGELLDGFPLKGNSIIDLRDSDKDDKIEILTRLDKYSIVSYELN